MSTVPYIFANDYGNIPLSYLDANFANVKAGVDFATSSLTANSANTATSATTAISAATVTASAQPAITSVGTLVSLSVTGNTATGNLSVTGNTATGNLSTNITTTTTLLASSATVSNSITSGTVTATEFVGDIRGSVFADDSTVIVDAVDNNINVSTATIGTLEVSSNGNINGNIYIGGVEIIHPSWRSFLSNTTTTLSNTTSYNVLYGNVSGLTITVDMPENPVEGQVTRMAISGNALTLALGNGNVNYDFSGLNQEGNTYAYVYRVPTQRWVRIA